MLVIARRDYLSGFGPKTFISNCSFSLLSTRTEICPLFPHSLELISAYSPPQLILPTWYKIALHVWSFGWAWRAQANTLSSSCMLIFVEWSNPNLCLCVCTPFLYLQVSSLASKLSLGCVDACENCLVRNLLKPRVNAMTIAMILLNVCNLLPCNISKLFFRYYGCIVSIRGLNLGPWHQKCDFCTSELMNARLSVLCTLKRAIGSVSGHLHAYSTLKRTGKRPARLLHA